MAEGLRMKSSCRNRKAGGNECIEFSFPPVLFFRPVLFLPVLFFRPVLFLPVLFSGLSCFCLYH